MSGTGFFLWPWLPREAWAGNMKGLWTNNFKSFILCIISIMINWKQCLSEREREREHQSHYLEYTSQRKRHTHRHTVKEREGEYLKGPLSILPLLHRGFPGFISWYVGCRLNWTTLSTGSRLSFSLSWLSSSKSVWYFSKTFLSNQIIKENPKGQKKNFDLICMINILRNRVIHE